MKKLWLGALILGVLPTMALADHRHYDRGDRYRHSRSSSGFEFSFGFGGSSRRYDDFSYTRVRYHSYDYPVYREPVYVPAQVYCPPPVVVYPAPRVYYYDRTPCYTPRYYYSETRYYYGR